METDKANQRAKEAEAIAKETAEKLKIFGRSTAVLLYGKQLSETVTKTAFPEDKVNPKDVQAKQKTEKTMEKAKTQWQFATNLEKVKVAEMEKILKDGQDKIKHLYEGAF